MKKYFVSTFPNPSRSPQLLNSPTASLISLCPQALHWVGNGGFDGLETNSKEGDSSAETPASANVHQADNDVSQQHQQQKVPQQESDYLGNRCSQYLPATLPILLYKPNDSSGWSAVLLNKMNGFAGEGFVFGFHRYMPGIREGDELLRTR